MALPSTAKKKLPEALSEKTKNALLRRIDAEKLIIDAIDKINHGSIESMETILRKIL